MHSDLCCFVYKFRSVAIVLLVILGINHITSMDVAFLGRDFPSLVGYNLPVFRRMAVYVFNLKVKIPMQRCYSQIIYYNI